MAVTTKLPIEVELALELMPCQALRRSYDSAPKPHPCAYFAEWGYYHTYDYATEGPPPISSIQLPVIYNGKRQVVPEMLSGCRKAPIVCVGINPNLPGWTSSLRNSIHPYFDDVLQYAHYFRYRTTDKRRVPVAEYEQLIGTETDQPSTARPLLELGKPVPAEPAPVLMYKQYQSLLDGLATKKGWAGHKLAVGEDIAYANMVACPSTRWVVTPNSEDPDMPVMGVERAKGLVKECFYDRRYFLRQLVQSLPAVIIVFSRTTAKEFITALKPKFSQGNPQPNEALEALFNREIRLLYGTLTDGTLLDARVIFMPHASASPEEFGQLRGPCIDRLAEEVDRGNLVFNSTAGHLRRGRGSCVFCSNSLYKIGKCDYESDLRPLVGAGIAPLAAGPADPLADRAEQLALLETLLPALPGAGTATVEPVLLAAEAAVPAPIALRGRVVPMDGTSVLDDGVVYVRNGRIQAISAPGAPAPAGFNGVAVTATSGVIYPGLVDLHNHLAYNILPLWKPPRRFDNRLQWQATREYRRDVGEVMSVLNNSGQNIIKAIVRYVEVKLMLGGVTSGQGMKSRFGGNQFYRGLVRNFEAPGEPGLSAAGSRIPDLETAADITALRKSLDNGRPFFFHLAEGLDPDARQQFRMLDDNQLLRRNLICIHSLALTAAQHKKLAQAGSKVVWSPLSNMLLYGQTIDPQTVVASETKFGLGSDWTPSGSRNVLQELKVALLCSRQAGNVLSAESLVKAATIDAAERAGWHAEIGSVSPSKLADLLVLDDRTADPFENLIHATEREIRLVVIGGQARHGDRDLMTAVGVPANSMESIVVGGRPKGLFLRDTGSPLGSLAFATAHDRLAESMARLGELRNAPAPIFDTLADTMAMELELDMQPPQFEGPVAMADLPPLQSVELDKATVIDDPGYFDRLEAISHLPTFLKGAAGLRGFYQ